MAPTAVAKSGYTPVATAAQMAEPRLAPLLPTFREAGTPNTSAKMFMNSGLLEPPPETTISRRSMPSSAHMASTFSFIVSAIASRIER